MTLTRVLTILAVAMVAAWCAQTVAQSPLDVLPANPFESAAPSGFEPNPTPGTGRGSSTGTRFTESMIKLIDRAELASTQTGVIAFEVPEEGTRVEKGAVIVQLDDKVPAASLKVAEAQASTDADILAKQAIAKVASKEVEQAEEANQRFERTVSPTELNRLYLTAERSRYDIDISKRDMAVAVARRDEAEALLGTYVIKAPFSGVIRKRLKRNGEAVRQGDPVVELVSTDRVRVIVRTKVDQLSVFQVGQQVQVVPEYNYRGSGSISGVVTFIDTFGDADVNLNRVDVHIEVQNIDGRLVPGLQATVIVP